MTVGEYLEWLGAAFLTFILLYVCVAALIDGYYSIKDMNKKYK